MLDIVQHVSQLGQSRLPFIAAIPREFFKHTVQVTLGLFVKATACIHHCTVSGYRLSGWLNVRRHSYRGDF
jgi:hypothetical protein